MEPEQFNWQEACNALVIRRHEMECAELHAARHPHDPSTHDAYVVAWRAHHAAVNDEFMARLVLR